MANTTLYLLKIHNQGLFQGFLIPCHLNYYQDLYYYFILLNSNYLISLLHLDRISSYLIRT